jgi:H+/gluconate symporter-like permease
MVVSLATDKGVWDAVLANEKIQEFRRTLRTAADGTLHFHHFTPPHPPTSGYAQHNVFCMEHQWFQTTV